MSNVPFPVVMAVSELTTVRTLVELLAHLKPELHREVAR